MASIKNRKSKGLALLVEQHLTLGDDSEPYFVPTPYAVRKSRFAATPAAKTLRPLRAIRARFADQLEQLFRAHGLPKDRDFYDKLSGLMRNFRKLADAGEGQLLQRWVRKDWSLV